MAIKHQITATQMRASYPILWNALVELGECNDNQPNMDFVFPSRIKQDAAEMEDFIAMLTPDEVTTFVDGEDREIRKIAARGGKVGRRTNKFLAECFDGIYADLWV